MNIAAHLSVTGVWEKGERALSLRRPKRAFPDRLNSSTWRTAGGDVLETDLRFAAAESENWAAFETPFARLSAGFSSGFLP